MKTKTKKTPQEPIEVVVPRSKWSRGYQIQNALLVTAGTIKDAKRSLKNFGPPTRRVLPSCPMEGAMCCLGFVAAAFGVSKFKLRDREMPSNTGALIPGLTKKEYGEIFDTDFSHKAAVINDAPSIKSDSVREKRLIALAKKHKVPYTFKFVD